MTWRAAESLPTKLAIIFQPFFPHIRLRALRSADVVRIPLQLLWLLFFKPIQPPSAGLPSRLLEQATAAVRCWLLAILARIDRWVVIRQSAQVPTLKPVERLLGKTGTLACLKSIGFRRTAFMIALVMLAAGATVPLNKFDQWLFSVFLLIGIALVQRGGLIGHFVALALCVLISLRYFFWRWNGALPTWDQHALTLSLLLLLAEMWLWASLLHRSFGFSWQFLGRKQVLGMMKFCFSISWICLLGIPAIALLQNSMLFASSMNDELAYLVPHLIAAIFIASGNQNRRSAAAELSLSVARGLFRSGRRFPSWVVPVLFWLNCAAVISVFAALQGQQMWSFSTPMLLLSGLTLPLLAVTMGRPLRTIIPREVNRARVGTGSFALMVRGLGVALYFPKWLFSKTVRKISVRLAWLEFWLPRSPSFANLLGVLSVGLALFLFPLPGQSQDGTSLSRNSAVNDADNVRRVTIRDLSGSNALSLRNSDGSASLYFGSRADELVTRMTLNLRYTYSPALLPKDSHIKIVLNGEVIGVAPVHGEEAGRPRTLLLDIDPRLVGDKNQLKFQFVGHYAQTCEDPLRNSLWASISGNSELITEYNAISLDDDLAALPEPFFDRRQLGQLQVPFVFSKSPALTTVNAAGIVASWFGKMAGDRGARFPANSDNVPPGHGVVVATNSDRPGFLAGHPKVSGPTIEIMTNPADGHSKLLLVLGRDGNDILLAAQSLVLGNVAMSGQQVIVRSRRDESPRRAYDVPNWVRNDRPTRFAELTSYPEQLQTVGHQPMPASMRLKLPPDIFHVLGRGVPVNLRYRYSPPAKTGESLLNVSVNGQLVQSLPLMAQEHVAARILGDSAMLAEGQRLELPLHKLKGDNDLSFLFAFSRFQEGPCPEVPPDDARRALIDPDSTIDLSDFYHFARLPNLNHFATVGFPFTKYADLSQTVLVLPNHPSPQEIEAAMNLLGHLSGATGAPASHVRIAGPGEESLLTDADLLVVGAAIGEGVFERWLDYLPATLNGEVRRVTQTTRTINAIYDWLGLGADLEPATQTQEKISGDGPLAMIIGFESPFSPGRSVVAVTATGKDQLWMAAAALGNPRLASKISGSVSYIRGERVDSLLVGETYLVGQLPWWVMIWLPLSVHPVLLALTTIAGVLLLVAALWNWRRRKPEVIADDA
jgi:hypothetical protein